MKFTGLILCRVNHKILDVVLTEGLVAASECDDSCRWLFGMPVWVVLGALVSPSVLVEKIITFSEITEWNVLCKHQALLLQ